VVEHLGGQKVHLYKSDAIAFAISKLDRGICDACTVRVWFDCPAATDTDGATSGVDE